jgi:hypothetical protein
MTLLRRLAAISVLLGLSLAAEAARAQVESASEASVADAVELKDGSYLRGLILEVEPASHVSIRLPDGQVRRIPVAEIETAERGGKSIALGVSPGAVTTPGPAPTVGAGVTAAAVPTAAKPRAESELDGILAAIPGPRVRVEAEANRAAFLQRLIGEPDEDAVGYHLVCKLPCRVDLPAGDLTPYRISNLRLQPTAWFQLPKYNARVHAELASDMWPIWQRSTMIGGFVFGAVGGSMLGINALTGEKEWARTTGYVLLGVGGAFLITSGIFWLFSPRTSYVVERAQ